MSQDEGTKKFDELKALAEDGKYQEALEKHIVFHEASREFPGFGGVRLSYALDTWIELAEKYPPAMDAFIALRNNNREILRQGDGSFDNFHDLSALNQALEEPEDTFNVFLEIHKKFPEQAKRYYHVAEKLIVERKKYDICATYITDPLKKYYHIRHLHEMNRKHAKKSAALDNDEFNNYANESYIFEDCQIIEIMAALGKKDIAMKIQKISQEYFENDSVKNAKCF